MKTLIVLLTEITVWSTLMATTVAWEFPREGSCHEGIPFADGRTGVLVWGGGDTINLTVGRGDLWDHRGGYPWTDGQSYTNIIALVNAGDANGLRALFSRELPPNWSVEGHPFTQTYNPYMLPLGRVVVKVPGASLARGELDTATGLGKLILADGREIGLAMSRDDHVFALKIPEGLDYFPFVKPATDFPVYDQILQHRGFKRAKQMSSLAFTWELPADKPVSLECENCPLSSQGRTLYVWARRDEPSPRPRLKSLGFDGLAGSSAAHWRRFWAEGARVKVPDRELQEIFDLGMYKFGSMTDPDGFAAGLQGQWLEDDRLVPWNGDYHFNINVQACYSPAFRGGHLEHLRPLFAMIRSWWPRLRENARRFCGVDDGFVLPHSVDDRGVCIGGFWTGTIDHASTAWVATMMYRYATYAQDDRFLREEAFPFMKGAMRVYEKMLEDDGERLALPLGPSPEWGSWDVRTAVGRNPSFQLAAIHRLARDLVAAARRLGVEPDPLWLDISRRLPRYASDKTGIVLFEGSPFVRSHRHHSHMAGLFPFDVIDPDAEDCRTDVLNTYHTWVARGPGEWAGWSFPWASVLHTHIGDAMAAVWMLKTWDAFFCNEGHGSRHDVYHPGISTMRRGENARAYGKAGDAEGAEIMQMDGQCAAAAAVMELMVHEVNGRVRYFRGCPASWRDVSFENLRLANGKRVSGRRIDGVIEIEERAGKE